MALAALLLAGTLAARPAAAAEGIYLTWNDCPLGSGAANRDFSCDTNLEQSELYCAFTLPQPAVNIVAVEIVLDLQHATAPLPDWWRLGFGGCRFTNPRSLAAAADFPGKTACIDMWKNAATPAIAEVAAYDDTGVRGAAGRARIIVTASVLPANKRDLDDTSMYYAARIILRHDRTVGEPSCAGCSGPACLVLNSIWVLHDQGSPGADYFLQVPGPGGANWARWQGGAGADCQAVPVLSRTWGAIKRLYR